MSPAEMRDIRACHDVEIEMIRRWPHLSPAAIKRLVRAGKDSIDYRENVISGAPLDAQRMSGILAYAKASEIGVLIHSAAEPEPKAEELSASDLERMSPAERMNYARRKAKK